MAQVFARVIAFGTLAACSSEPAAPPAIRFLHTFSPAETELFNTMIAGAERFAVESSIVPFARGQQVIGEILRAGTACPDLIRIDATWLPGLRAELAPVPPDLAGLDWTKDAAALVFTPGDPTQKAVVFPYTSQIDQYSGDPTYQSPTLLATTKVLYPKSAAAAAAFLGRKVTIDDARSIRAAATSLGLRTLPAGRTE